MTSSVAHPSDRQPWLARILREGRIYGCGIYVGDRLVITASHVVSGSLGLEPKTTERPAGKVIVQFPQIEDTSRQGRIVAWIPPGPKNDGDIALIELDSEPPPSAMAAPLLDTQSLRSHRCRIYGYPEGFTTGRWATGEVVGPIDGGLWQLEVQGVDRGFSGSPVWDEELDGVIGMLALFAKDQSMAFMIPATALADTLQSYKLSDGQENASDTEVRPQDTADERSASDQVDWVPDSAATSDSLGRSPLARAIAIRLRRLQAESPGQSFLIHIDGEWGAGKTSLLNFIREEFKSDWQVVDFDSWRQCKLGPPWWSLLTTLRFSLRRSLNFSGRMRLRAIEAFTRLRRGGGVYLLALLGVALFSFGIYLLFRPQLNTNTTADIAKTVTAALGAVATLWVGALAAARFLLWDSPRGARFYENSNTNPMESVADHFTWLIQESARPVLFLVDDLDRAPAAYVVELLETIETLIRNAPQRARTQRSLLNGCHFIVAADGAWIRESFESSYTVFTSSIGEPGRPLGYLFLDKIFQLNVSVPAMSEEGQERYLSQLLGVGIRLQPQKLDLEREALYERVRSSKSEDEIVEALRTATPIVREAATPVAIESFQSREVELAQEHFLQQFSHLLRPNPRSMKRYISAYSLARSVMTIQGILIPGPPLALWLIIQTRWPSLADFLQVHPELLDQFIVPKGKLRSVALIPETLRSLVDNEDVREVLTYSIGGPLTPDIIRQMSGRSKTQIAQNRIMEDTADGLLPAEP